MRRPEIACSVVALPVYQSGKSTQPHPACPAAQGMDTSQVRTLLAPCTSRIDTTQVAKCLPRLDGSTRARAFRLVRSAGPDQSQGLILKAMAGIGVHLIELLKVEFARPRCRHGCHFAASLLMK